MRDNRRPSEDWQRRRAINSGSAGSEHCRATVSGLLDLDLVAVSGRGAEQLLRALATGDGAPAVRASVVDMFAFDLLMIALGTNDCRPIACRHDRLSKIRTGYAAWILAMHSAGWPTIRSAQGKNRPSVSGGAVRGGPRRPGPRQCRRR